MFCVSVWLFSSSKFSFKCDYMTYNPNYNDILLWLDGELITVFSITDIEHMSVIDVETFESEL